MRILLSLLLIAGTTPVQAGEIYRWVDEAGNVHFSDKKPAVEAVEKVDVDVPEPALEPDEGEKRRLALVREAEERFRPTVVLTREDEPAPFDRAGACRDARRNYGALQENMPVYRAVDGNYRPQWQGDHYTGERTYVADTEREATVDGVLDDIYEHCEAPRDWDALWDAYEAWFEQEQCDISGERLEKAARASSRTPLDELERMRREHGERCG